MPPHIGSLGLSYEFEGLYLVTNSKMQDRPKVYLGVLIINNNKSIDRFFDELSHTCIVVCVPKVRYRGKHNNWSQFLEHWTKVYPNKSPV